MQIYADNAATTKPSKAAVRAMLSCLEQNYGNPSSLHHIGQAAAEALLQARQDIAGCLGCTAREIYFTSGGSEADNQALRSAAYAGARSGKKHLISTAIEHHAILHTLKQLEEEGFSVTLLPVSKPVWLHRKRCRRQLSGHLSGQWMFANNEIGTIEPIAEIGAVCREKGVLFHTDAVQAVGHVPIDLSQLPVDMLSLSAHKFHGPKGVGVLYAKRGTPLHSLICGGAQERGMRAGTENLPAIAGMAAALREACANLEQNAAYVAGLRDRLIAGLETIPHSLLSGDRKNRLAGNVNFCFEGVEGEALLLLLDAKGICASSGSACTSGSLEPSHVLAVGVPYEAAHGSLRLSLSAENTPEEVEYLLKAVPEVVTRLRSMSPVWRDLEEGRKPHVI